MKLEKIKKQFEGKIIFNDYDLTLDEGKIYCVMGESGRGKTTLLRMIAGLEPIDGGRIILKKDALCSMVFQEERFFEWESVWKNIAIVLEGKERKARNLKEMIVSHLQRVGLENVAEVPVKELSGGMKRRVSLVRGMMAKSSYILMDEPFTGLDEATKEKAIQYVLEEQKGRTILLTTHSKEEVKKLNGRLILLPSYEKDKT